MTNQPVRMLSAEETDELETLLKAATPGEWQEFDGTLFHSGSAYFEVANDLSKEDGALVAALYNAAPALLESARRYQRLAAAEADRRVCEVLRGLLPDADPGTFAGHAAMLSGFVRGEIAEALYHACESAAKQSQQ